MELFEFDEKKKIRRTKDEKLENWKSYLGNQKIEKIKKNPKLENQKLQNW